MSDRLRNATRDELCADVERLREAIRRRDERITDEKLASFIARANGNSSSRAWRIVGYLARCVQDERDDRKATDARLEAVRALIRNRRELDNDTTFLLDALEAALEQR